MERKMLWVGVSIVFLIAATGLVLLTTRRQTPYGVVLSPAAPAAPIDLTDQNGQPFKLSDQQGKFVLVYFGYTDCPEECPVTMAKLARALDELGSTSSQVQVVLITTDPETDGPQQLKEYLKRFRPDFLGLSGSQAELQKVWSEYGVVVMDDGETHSTRTYVIDRDGDLVMTFPYEMTVDEIASDLRRLIDSN